MFKEIKLNCNLRHSNLKISTEDTRQKILSMKRIDISEDKSKYTFFQCFPEILIMRNNPILTFKNKINQTISDSKRNCVESNKNLNHSINPSSSFTNRNIKYSKFSSNFFDSNLISNTKQIRGLKSVSNTYEIKDVKEK